MIETLPAPVCRPEGSSSSFCAWGSPRSAGRWPTWDTSARSSWRAASCSKRIPTPTWWPCASFFPARPAARWEWASVSPRPASAGRWPPGPGSPCPRPRPWCCSRWGSGCWTSRWSTRAGCTGSRWRRWPSWPSPSGAWRGPFAPTGCAAAWPWLPPGSSSSSRGSGARWPPSWSAGCAAGLLLDIDSPQSPSSLSASVGRGTALASLALFSLLLFGLPVAARVGPAPRPGPGRQLLPLRGAGFRRRPCGAAPAPGQVVRPVGSAATSSSPATVRRRPSPGPCSPFPPISAR